MTGSAAPEQPFAAPWHAEVFALAVHLNERGLFQWEEWTRRFASNLAEAARGSGRSTPQNGLDGADDYYEVWLATLVEMVRVKSDIEPVMIDRIEAEWRAAYLATPHGQPVRI